MRFFFYGTLMDPDICRAVLGVRADRLRLRPAVLTGYRRVRASCGNFPVLVRRTGGFVPGLLVEGLDYDALLVMAHFEGTEYEPRRALAIERDGRRVTAWLFLPSDRRFVTARRWELSRWRQSGKSLLLRQVQRWMLAYGADSLQSPDVRWHVRRRIRCLPAAGGGLANRRRAG
jgi:hypothetical protein